ncbi:extracellular solute-binding protein [Thermopolyspora sp. NPDC052614]|uniref:ABC transporter substrate-binding protein n=1 Tax=Thermopolyspora sp. NPDC052614 TaxID=3155682 RepID=UPI00341B7E70
MFTAPTRTRIGAGLTGLAVAAMLALSGCASSAPANSGKPIQLAGASAEVNTYINELYQKALDSGKTSIVLYGPAVSTDAALYEAFSKRFPGITFVPQDSPDSQTFTKLQVEAESGSRAADLFAGGSSSIVQFVRENPNICKVPDIRTASDGLITYSDKTALLYYKLTSFVFVYNTNLVSEDEAPKSWNDLLDPKWKGKLEMGDPTVPSGARHILTQLLVPESADKWGEAYVEKLATQDVNIAESEPTIPADIASGRFPVGIFVYSGFYAAQKAKGAPIKAVFPLEGGGTYFGNSGICTITDSPNADAATLFLNWLFSKEGQAALIADPNSYSHLIKYTGDLPLPREFDPLPDGADPDAIKKYGPVIDRIFR